ncbi:hypothetical protein C8Q80DRAFT_1149517 [Daedaleopsis nitida]|nr:hypothetical protein C8Q80DRAFT_1149517 [Daedaleopsis nitida]
MHLLLQLVAVVVVTRGMYLLGLLGNSMPQAGNGDEDGHERRPRRQAIRIGRFTLERELGEDDARPSEDDEAEAVGAQQGNAQASEDNGGGDC